MATTQEEVELIRQHPLENTELIRKLSLPVEMDQHLLQAPPATKRRIGLKSRKAGIGPIVSTPKQKNKETPSPREVAGKDRDAAKNAGNKGTQFQNKHSYKARLFEKVGLGRARSINSLPVEECEEARDDINSLVADLERYQTPPQSIHAETVRQPKMDSLPKANEGENNRTAIEETLTVVNRSSGKAKQMKEDSVCTGMMTYNTPSQDDESLSQTLQLNDNAGFFRWFQPRDCCMVAEPIHLSWDDRSNVRSLFTYDESVSFIQAKMGKSKGKSNALHEEAKMQEVKGRSNAVQEESMKITAVARESHIATLKDEIAVAIVKQQEAEKAAAKAVEEAKRSEMEKKSLADELGKVKVGESKKKSGLKLQTAKLLQVITDSNREISFLNAEIFQLKKKISASALQQESLVEEVNRTKMHGELFIDRYTVEMKELEEQIKSKNDENCSLADQINALKREIATSEDSRRLLVQELTTKTDALKEVDDKYQSEIFNNKYLRKYISQMKKEITTAREAAKDAIDAQNKKLEYMEAALKNFQGDIKEERLKNVALKYEASKKNACEEKKNSFSQEAADILGERVTHEETMKYLKKLGGPRKTARSRWVPRLKVTSCVAMDESVCNSDVETYYNHSRGCTVLSPIASSSGSTYVNFPKE